MSPACSWKHCYVGECCNLMFLFATIFQVMHKLREEAAYITMKEHGGDSIGRIVEHHLRREVGVLCGTMDVYAILEGAKEASILGNLVVLFL